MGEGVEAGERKRETGCAAFYAANVAFPCNQAPFVDVCLRASLCVCVCVSKCKPHAQPANVSCYPLPSPCSCFYLLYCLSLPSSACIHLFVCLPASSVCLFVCMRCMCVCVQHSRSSLSLTSLLPLERDRERETHALLCAVPRSTLPVQCQCQLASLAMSLCLHRLYIF